MRPFNDTLNAVRFGQLQDELTVKFDQLIQACRDTGKTGEITLKLKLRPLKGSSQQVEISDAILLNKPEFDNGTTIMFINKDGNLQREDPRQMSLEGLRQVDTDTGEIKLVKNS